MRVFKTLAVAVFLILPGMAGAAELKPHKATLKVTLKGAPGGAKAEGSSVMSIMQRCKTWDVRQSMNLTIEAKGRPGLVMVLNQESAEAIDGKSLNAKTLMTVNGQQIRSTDKGTAAGLGKAGKVEVDRAGMRETVELPDGAYFHAAGTNRIVRELADGKKAFTVKTYDSAAAHAVSEQAYAVVPSPFTAAALPADASGLLKGQSWVVKVTSSFNGRPSEIFLQIHESGVVSRMLQSVSGMQVEFTLDTLQSLPATGC